MVKAWYLETVGYSESNRMLPNMSERPVSLEYLQKQCGIKYWQVGETNREEILRNIRETGQYDYEDEVAMDKNAPDYEAKCTLFYEEHFHAGMESRLVVEGSGYFDIRDSLTDEWIRLEVVKGDALALPAGIHHRFTLDTKEYVKERRFFRGSPVRSAITRPMDDHPARVDYVQKYAQKI